MQLKKSISWKILSWKVWNDLEKIEFRKSSWSRKAHDWSWKVSLKKNCWKIDWWLKVFCCLKLHWKLSNFIEIFPTSFITVKLQLSFLTSARTFQLQSFQFHFELFNSARSFPTQNFTNTRFSTNTFQCSFKSRKTFLTSVRTFKLHIELFNVSFSNYTFQQAFKWN